MLCLALGGMLMLSAEAIAAPDGVERTLLYEVTVPSGAIPVGLAKIPVNQWTVAPGWRPRRF